MDFQKCKLNGIFTFNICLLEMFTQIVGQIGHGVKGNQTLCSLKEYC